MTITSSFAVATEIGNLKLGMNIEAGSTLIVPNGTVLKNEGNDTGLSNEGNYNPTTSTAIDVRLGGNLIGATGQQPDNKPADDTGGTVSGLVIRHHTENWVETESGSGIYIPSSRHGFISNSLKIADLKEMIDEGSLQTIYRGVGVNAPIGSGKTIFLTNEPGRIFGPGELEFVKEEQLISGQNKTVILAQTVVINNSNDNAGEIKGNLVNKDFLLSDKTVSVPEKYGYATNLRLISGAYSEEESANRSLTLSGDNRNFAGNLIIGDGKTVGVVYMGASENGNPKNALGGTMNITVNNNAELNLRGAGEERIETNGNWDFFGNAKLTSDRRIDIKSNHIVTFGKPV